MNDFVSAYANSLRQCWLLSCCKEDRDLPPAWLGAFPELPLLASELGDWLDWKLYGAWQPFFAGKAMCVPSVGTGDIINRARSVLS